MKRLSVFLLWAIPAIGFSQSELYQRLKTKYPDEPAVYVDRTEVVSIVAEKDSLRAFAEINEEVLMLKDQAEVFSSKKVYGSLFNEVKNLSAKTLVWDKNRYKAIPVTQFKKSSDQDHGIFFDDSYSYSFNFPSASSQNRLVTSYMREIKDVRFLSNYIFSGYVPQSKVTFTIKTSKGIELFYEVLNDPQKKLQLRTYEKGGFVFYEWSQQDLEGLKPEEDSPAIQYFAPQIVYYVKSYPSKKGRVSLLSGLDDLYRWYYTFVKDLNKNSSPELKEIVKKIQSQSTSELDLVKKIFYWVQDNIQYIAFEEGMRGLIPHTGSYVCDKRFGDCKDMANLIVNMLQLANVKAYHTWIGTRDLPFQYTKLPTPLVDNHMIATYKSNDGIYYFLDGTDHHIQFGMPTSMIQGKEALVGLDSVHYEIKTVPVISKEVNVMTDSMKVSINGNFIIGKGVNSLKGYAKTFGDYRLTRTDQEDVKNYVTRLVSKGNNKFFLDQYQISTPNKDNPTRISYEFRIGDYFQKVGNEIYVNMNFNKDFYNEIINTVARKTPMENEYQHVKNDFVEMTVPSGYEVEYLPPNSKSENGVLGCTIEYQTRAGKILCTKKFYLNYLMLQPDQFKDWNEVVSQISNAYKETIILRKK